MKQNYFLRIIILFIIPLMSSNSIIAQGTETFTNVPTSSSTSYITRNWTGDDGSAWEATNSRTSSATFIASGQGIGLNDDNSNTYVKSGTISGGIENITLTVKQIFSGSNSGNVTVYINDTSVGTVPYDNTETGVTTSINGINVGGDFVIRVSNDVGGNNGGGDNRVAIDNITWTAYASSVPTLSVNDSSVAEGDSGTTNLTFTVSLSEPAPAGGATVDYATSNGTASAGTDYSSSSGTLSFSAGETSKTIDVTISSDETAELDETITLTLSNPTGTGVVIGDAIGLGTITNDDKITLIISEVSDPGDDIDGRFLEIYNNGDSSIDLDAFEVYFVKSTNAGTSYPELALTGTILPNQVMTIASSSDMNSTYGFTPDFSDSDANGNGDDAYYLYFGGGRTSGDILDAYGVIGVDGSGQAWEYEDSRAIRNTPKSVTPKSSWTSSEWTISSANVANMTPGALENEFRYDGNWKPRDVYVNSSTTDDVYITSSVNLNGNISIDNFEVDGSATVTIDSGIGLIVGGTSTGNITYNRNIPTTNWYLVSSPVVGQDIDAFVASEGLASGTTGNNLGLSDYNNTTPGWEYYQNGASGTGNFTSGDGRAIKLASTGDIAFTGTINTSDVNISITDATGSGGSAFNLVGNPYPSFIAANNNADGTNNILKVNDTDNDYLTESTIWFWNQGTSSYNQINHASAAKYIAPGQGFFLSANGSNSLSITEAMQSHQGTDSFQRLTTRPEIALSLSNGTAIRNADIYYIEGTTTGWDNGYDSSIFGGVSNEFAIYTHTVANGNGRDLGIQSLPNNDFESMIIPVGINAEAGTAITIDAATNNFPTGINIYLEDKQDNSFTLLEADANFSFTPENNLSGIGRFYLHTTSSVLSADDFDINKNISIYTSGNNNLRIVGVQNGKATVQLYNILGKEMLKTSFEGNGVNNINLNTIPMGIYIVKLATENGVLNRKIIIK